MADLPWPAEVEHQQSAIEKTAGDDVRFLSRRIRELATRLNQIERKLEARDRRGRESHWARFWKWMDKAGDD